MKQAVNSICHVGMAVMMVWGMMGCSMSGDNHSHNAHAHQHDEHEGEEHEIELTDLQMQTVGISLGQMELREMSEGLMANGVLAVNPQDVAKVSPLVAGTVASIHVREGDMVKQGTTVAQIENMEILTWQQDYRQALEELRLATSEKERQESLAAQGAGIRKNLEQAQAAYHSTLSRKETLAMQLRQIGLSPETVAQGGMTGRVAVKAPISGVVSKIHVTTGSYTDMSQPIMTVTDNSQVHALLRVYEKDLSKVQEGQKADLTLINEGRTLQGTVAGINSTLDPETKGIAVKVALTETTPGMLPGMALTAYIQTGTALTTALPEEAVVSTGGRNYIYILTHTHEENGHSTHHFEPQEVATGHRRQGYVEVTPTTLLPPEAQIVVRKAFYLASMSTDHGEHNH